MEIKRKAGSTGWLAKQISHKARNPLQSVDPHNQSIYQLFSKDASIKSLIRKDSVEGVDGHSIYRRIVVSKACLNCHGSYDRRPEFIVEKYPKDQAHGFEVGELRGLYYIFVPEESK